MHPHTKIYSTIIVLFLSLAFFPSTSLGSPAPATVIEGPVLEELTVGGKNTFGPSTGFKVIATETFDSVDSNGEPKRPLTENSMSIIGGAEVVSVNAVGNEGGEDIAVGNVVGGGESELVEATTFEDSGSYLTTLAVRAVDNKTGEQNTLHSVELHYHHITVVTLDIDDDAIDEVVVGGQHSTDLSHYDLTIIDFSPQGVSVNDTNDAVITSQTIYTLPGNKVEWGRSNRKAFELHTGDVNGDYHEDLLVWGGSPQTLGYLSYAWVFTADNDSQSFTLRQTWQDFDATMTSACLGDYDMDGLDEVVVLGYLKDLTNEGADLFQGGIFDDMTNNFNRLVEKGTEDITAIVEDFDGDRKRDLVTIVKGGDYIGVRIRNHLRDDTFWSEDVLASDVFFQGTQLLGKPQAADIDWDGVPELHIPGRLQLFGQYGVHVFDFQRTELLTEDTAWPQLKVTSTVQVSLDYVGFVPVESDGWVKYALGDINGSSTTLSYTHKTWTTMTNPTVMAVMAAPPTVRGISQNHFMTGTEFGKVRGTSTTLSSTVAVDFGVSVGVGVEAEFSVGGFFEVVGVEVKVGVTIDTELATTASYTKSFETSTSWWTDSSHDGVLFIATTVRHWQYAISTADDPGAIGKSVNISRVMSRSLIKADIEYFDHMFPEYKLDSGTFEHTIGDPRTYGNVYESTRFSRENLFSTDMKTVSQGGGYDTLSVSLKEELAFEVSSKVRIGAYAYAKVGTCDMFVETEVRSGITFGLAASMAMGEAMFFQAVVGQIADWTEYDDYRYDYKMFVDMMERNDIGISYLVIDYVTTNYGIKLEEGDFPSNKDITQTETTYPYTSPFSSPFEGSDTNDSAVNEEEEGGDNPLTSLPVVNVLADAMKTASPEVRTGTSLIFLLMTVGGLSGLVGTHIYSRKGKKITPSPKKGTKGGKKK